MARNPKRPAGYAPLLEFCLRRKPEGGSLLVPAVFRGLPDAIARRECVVLVHGFNSTEGEAAAAYFGFRRRQNEIFASRDSTSFDRRFGDAFWPGDADSWSVFDKVDFLVYPSAVRTAIKAGEQLANLLLSMPALERMDFIAHSLGCRVALEALLHLRRQSTPLVRRVCLMAAAVPSEMLEPAGRFYGLVEQLTDEGTLIENLRSMEDTVLQWAFPPGQKFAGKGESSDRALGRFGIMPDMPGFGSTLTDVEIRGVSHGDYWGQGGAPSSRQAAEAAGKFLRLGATPRDVDLVRNLGPPMQLQPRRDLGASRDLGGVA